MIFEEIYERFYDYDLVIIDGFNEAVIGIEEESTKRLIYSVSKCLEILERDMTSLDALEHFHFNISGAYIGENAPIFCRDAF